MMFDDNNKYFDENDNYGAFGAVEGSDSFISRGNNIPAQQLEEKDLDPPTTISQEDPKTPMINQEGEEEFTLVESKKKKRQRKKEIKELEESKQLDEPVKTDSMDFSVEGISPLHTRTKNPELKAQKFNIKLDVPQEYQSILKTVLNSQGKKLVATKEELLPIYSYLMGTDQSGSSLTSSKIQSVVKKLVKQKLNEKASQEQAKNQTSIPMYFDFGFK